MCAAYACNLPLHAANLSNNMVTIRCRAILPKSTKRPWNASLQLCALDVQRRLKYFGAEIDQGAATMSLKCINRSIYVASEGGAFRTGRGNVTRKQATLAQLLLGKECKSVGSL